MKIYDKPYCPYCGKHAECGDYTSALQTKTALYITFKTTCTCGCAFKWQEEIRNV